MLLFARACWSLCAKYSRARVQLLTMELLTMTCRYQLQLLHVNLHVLKGQFISAIEYLLEFNHVSRLSVW